MTGKDYCYHFCYWEKQSLKRLIICTTESLFQYRNREQMDSLTEGFNRTPRTPQCSASLRTEFQLRDMESSFLPQPFLKVNFPTHARSLSKSSKSLLIL